MDFESIRSGYSLARKKYMENRDTINEKITRKMKDVRRLQAEADELRQKRDSLACPSWIDCLLEPLAGEIASRIGWHYEIYGPIGLRGRTMICFVKDPSLPVAQQCAKSLTVFADDLDEGLLRYEARERLDEHPKDFHGVDDGTLPLPDNIDEIISLLQDSREGNAKRTRERY